MSTPQILTPVTLLTHATPFIENANNLLQQSNNAIIDSSDADAKCADAIKICTVQLDKLDKARRSLVDPLNAHVKWINGEFKKVAATIEQAKENFKAKSLEWKKAEERRQREESERLKREAEEQALAAAEQAQAAGNAAAAEAALEIAIATPDMPVKTIARGDYTGASSSIRREWKGEAVNVVEICRGIVEGRVPPSVIREFSKNEINRWAKAEAEKRSLPDESEAVVDGIRVYHAESLANR